MESTSPVRIVVLTASAGSPDAGDSGGAFRDTLDALARLGGDVELELVRDAETAAAATAGGSVDLVLVDRVERAASAALLGALAASGPPVVLVTAASDESQALDAFRRGAADCVRVGPDYADVLPVVVLEQIRRGRSQRARGVAERQIRDLRQYNEDIIHNLNSALLVIDDDGTILTANTTAEEILACESGTLVGRRVWEWLDDETPEASVIGRTLWAGHRFKGQETRLRLADGGVIPIGMSCSPLVVEPEPGVETGRRAAVAIFQDLSEVKQLQRQVLQTEKMASIGQLAAGVAHEINNPMGFIHANLFQMSEYLADLRQSWERVEELQKAILDARGEDGLAAIRAASDALSALSRELDLDFVQTDFAKAVRESQEGAERIRHIVKDLRDFSREGSDECVEADVNHCLDSTASIAWTMMKHSVVLEKDYGDLPPVRCYPGQLKQVFMNLLVNAYQAIEEKVGDSGETGRIDLRSELADAEVRVTIRDTGAGITPRDLDRIFDPFFTTKEVGAGIGLGLATSYSIVRRHSGRIEVESEPGVGTTFTVWLPVAGPEVG